VKVVAVRGFVHAPTMLFRGTRDYLHSTDIYDELIAGVQAAGLPPIDGIVALEMRMPITSQPKFHFGDAPSSESPAPASFKLGIQGDLVSGAIFASNRPVVASRPYDESRISREARINGRKVELFADTGMSPIEVVTALGVHQHKTLFPPPLGKRWLLARLFLRRPLRPQDTTTITISLDRVVGKSMTRSGLTTFGEQLGHMDFVLGSASAQSTVGSVS
jgi:hypothetical protein